jgi:ATP-dependent helicase HrpA
MLARPSNATAMDMPDPTPAADPTPAVDSGPACPAVPAVASLRARLDDLLLRDADRLGRRLRDLEHGRTDGGRRGRGRRAEARTVEPASALAAIAAELDEAEARAASRAASVPALHFPEELPITARADEIVQAIRDHQVVVVAGETGSGKSTQLPKLCLAAGRGVRGMIGHTQPRRLAARTIAERVAEELGSEVGGTVGYQVRFTDRVGERTLVKVMTDGILLNETQRDRQLLRYDTIIVDEAHERSLNIDFLLGYLTRLLRQRPDLKVVITSATIDTERFAAHFGAPVVEVSGRTYPVEVRYRPYAEDRTDDRDQVQAICDAVEELQAEEPGDVLVFLSGEREIHDTADALRRLHLRDTEVLPLYARLPSADQHRIFQPHRGRRVVLATNVAETSITVPGIRAVVDAGTARISRYSRRLKVQRLPIEPVSQASANQRAGRCGRLGPGVCIRLYSEEDFERRPEFTEPEILRTNLASVVLQMAALGLGDVASFPFVDPPDSRAVKDGVDLLEELGAFAPPTADARNRLTPLGRRLAQLPLDPRLGRMVLEAERNACVREVIVIAAALSIQDPRERPAELAGTADELHRRFRVEGSDFLSYVALWDHLRQQQKELSGNQFRKLCRAELLNYLRVREWQDVVSQLRHVTADLGLRRNEAPADPDAVHRSLLAGLLSHVGLRDGASREYLGARQARFLLQPGSALASKPPTWVMVGELVETSRLFGRVAARVQPEWCEDVGAHVVKRSYSEPRWDARKAMVVATERVTLYGLPVVTGRTVGYARVDPAGARDLFIWHALVEGDWETHHRFVDENRRRVAEVEALEARVRRRDLLVGEQAIFDFFDERVDPDVVSGRHFDRWWTQVQREQPDRLTFPLSFLLDQAAGPVDPSGFPDTWQQGDVRLALTYEFDPASPTDGVTVHVPLLAIERVDAAGFDWHVPGHRPELVAALLRTIPKQLRRHVVPAAEHAAAFLTSASPAGGSLLDQLARSVGRAAGTPVSAAEFDLDRLPPWLRLTFVVEGDDRRPLAAGKDLDELRHRLGGRLRTAIARAAPVAERTGMRSWELGELPRSVEVLRGGQVATGYPALVDEGETVGVRILAKEADQARLMRRGTRKLLLLTIASPRKQLERLVGNDVKLAIARMGLGPAGELVDDCVTAAVDDLLERHGGPAWDPDGFAALREAVRGDLTDVATPLVRLAGRAVVRAAAVRATLDRPVVPALAAAHDDEEAHLGRLVGRGFVTHAGARRLPHVVRYLEAVERRLEKLASEPGRDRDRMVQVQRLEAELARLEAGLPPDRRAEAAEVWWMIEELRVSLFAQSLGTAGPVSEQRVRRALAALTP